MGTDADRAGQTAARATPARLMLAVALTLVWPLASACAGSDTPATPTTSGRLVAQAPVTSNTATAAQPLGRSVPVSLAIPAIGVHSPLLVLGLNADGTAEVPPLESTQAGWYEGSPTPGELGPAVVLGHVDSARSGPGVFFDLRALRAGDAVEVTRADGSTATFRVDAVEQYPKSAFPTAAVYGDIDHAGLRLITCGGAFDSAKRSYEDNVVVYASLVSASSVSASSVSAGPGA